MRCLYDIWVLLISLYINQFISINIKQCTLNSHIQILMTEIFYLRTSNQFIQLLDITVVHINTKVFHEKISLSQLIHLISVWWQNVSCLFWALRQHLLMRFVLGCIQSVAHVTIIINLWPVNIAYAVFRRFLSIESSIDVVQPSQHLLPQHNVDPRIENLVPGGKPYGKKIRRVVWNLLQRNVCYNSYLNGKKRKEIAFIIIALVCNFQFKRDWSWCEPIFFLLQILCFFLVCFIQIFWMVS